jgi:TonB-dependent SusC/RagA subfamily outer membrane receptor
MITSSKKPGYQYLRKILVLPVAILVIGLFAFSCRYEQAHLTTKLNEPKSQVEKVIAPAKGKKLHDNLITETAVRTNAITPRDTIKPTDKVLIVIDGKEQGSLTIKELDTKIKVEDISSISVLTDKAAIAIYGEKGKNGVIVINTKQKDVTVKDVMISDTTRPRKDETTRKDSTDNMIWEKVEVEAAFPGGEGAFNHFIEKNLDASVPVRNGAPEGKYTVWLQFVVDREGHVSDFKILSNCGYGMEREALRVMKKATRWVPAIQNGRNVKSYKKQSINFIVGQNPSAAINNAMGQQEMPSIRLADLKKATPADL